MRKPNWKAETIRVKAKAKPRLSFINKPRNLPRQKRENKSSRQIVQDASSSESEAEVKPKKAVKTVAVAKPVPRNLGMLYL